MIVAAFELGADTRVVTATAGALLHLAAKQAFKKGPLAPTQRDLFVVLRDAAGRAPEGRRHRWARLSRPRFSR